MIVPAAVRYLGQLNAAGTASRAVVVLSDRVGALVDRLSDAIDQLEHAQHSAHESTDVHDEARVFVDRVIPAQLELRAAADELETLVPTTCGRCPNTASYAQY